MNAEININKERFEVLRLGRPAAWHVRDKENWNGWKWVYIGNDLEEVNRRCKEIEESK